MSMGKILIKSVVASIMMLLCASVVNAASPKGESIEFKSAKKTVLDVTVDGKPCRVTWYVDNYVTKPNKPDAQLINIYVPENATKQSPVMFYVNNGGWIFNDYPANTIENGRNYDGINDKLGVALKEGYVVVSYGCRSRADAPVDGRYQGHSPATMTDTKAAIRYLRYNRKALPAGDVEKIVITGTSGGGALSTLIAASGNSADFLPSLYEIGAAGVVRNPDGSYSSAKGCGDNVFGVIAYCPITDLAHACAAYEWLYNGTRKALYLAGEMNYRFADEKTIISASDILSQMYPSYIDSLGLKDDKGNSVNSANLRRYISELMEKEIARAVEELGPEQMKKDIERRRRVNNGWIVFNDDGSYSYDLEKHLYYVARYTTLKPAPSFSNKGFYRVGQNEDTIFGDAFDEYCAFNAYSWEHDSVKNNVGKDDTGMSWEEFMNTEKGGMVALQLKMTSAMDYILEGKSDIAPNWYVRHGMDDRDTSFAVEATLFCAIQGSSKVKDHNVGFSWLKPHSGDYDVPEAYAWLGGLLK